MPDKKNLWFVWRCNISTNSISNTVQISTTIVSTFKITNKKSFVVS